MVVHRFHYRCDVIAMGVINAAQNIGMKKPIIIRLKGTNVEEAKKLIEVHIHTYMYTYNTMNTYAKLPPMVFHMIMH